MTHDATPATVAQIEQLLEAALKPVKDQIQMFATKDDVQLVVQAALQPIKEDMRVLKQDMHTRFEWLHEGVDQSLIVLGNVQKKFEGEISNHNHRIKRLEKKAGLAQAAI